MTLIPGDGIGRELTDAVKLVFNAAGAPVEWETVDLTMDDPCFSDKVSQAVYSLRRNKIGLKGSGLLLVMGNTN